MIVLTPNLIIVLTGVLGATLTFYVSEELKQGPVRASALLSLIVGLFFYCFPNALSTYLTINIQIVFIGTSFIGMVSSHAMKSYKRLAVAGSLFSIIYINSNNLFEGYGGALGALALIALLATMGTSTVLSKRDRIASRFIELRNWMVNQKD